MPLFLLMPQPMTNFNKGCVVIQNMGNDEWIEIAPLWKPRTEGSRLLAKGTIERDLKAGQKVLILHNQYATEENRQPSFRLMIVEENGDALIDLETGDPIQRDIDEEMSIDEAQVNPHGMG